MIHSEAIDRFDIWDGARSGPTPRTFIRAAGLANLLVATMVFAEFSVVSPVEHDPKTFRLGPWLVPFVAPVIRAGAALLHTDPDPTDHVHGRKSPRAASRSAR